MKPRPPRAAARGRATGAVTRSPTAPKKTPTTRCHRGHRSAGKPYDCLDRQRRVCPRCCVEHCREESPEDFARCARLGHPTWPTGSSKRPPKRIVCLEGYWDDDDVFDRSSVRPFLEGLADARGDLVVAHRRVDSLESLERIATSTLWEDRAAWDTPLYYLAFHGRKGRLSLSEDEAGLSALRRYFEDYGAFPHILYFGSCSTLGGRSGEKLANQLLEHADSRAIIGYEKNVDWVRSMLVDLLFVQKFFDDDDPWNRLPDIHQSVLDELPFAHDLGFRIFTP